MGAENYVQWPRQVTLALKGERLWNHCSSGTDPKDFAEVATTKPEPKDPAAVTDTEKEKILDWLAKDTQAKALIDRKISSVIANQLNESQTAHKQWEILSKCYLHTNLLSQYKLRARVRSEKLKDTNNAPQYLGIFEDAHRHFIQMRVSYSNDEAIFDLLQGLPDGVEWQIFKEFTLNHMSTSLATTPASTTSPAPLNFDDIAKLFTEKANIIIGRRKLAGLGSKYVNIAVIQGTGSNIKINPATGLRMHCNNPMGVKDMNPLCTNLPRADNHDHAHCYWPGGGMESKVPAWIHNKRQEARDHCGSHDSPLKSTSIHLQYVMCRPVSTDVSCPVQRSLNFPIPLHSSPLYSTLGPHHTLSPVVRSQSTWQVGPVLLEYGCTSANSNVPSISGM